MKVRMPTLDSGETVFRQNPNQAFNTLMAEEIKLYNSSVLNSL